jgi:hypothetical protein
MFTKTWNKTQGNWKEGTRYLTQRNIKYSSNKKQLDQVLTAEYPKPTSKASGRESWPEDRQSSSQRWDTISFPLATASRYLRVRQA